MSDQCAGKLKLTERAAEGIAATMRATESANFKPSLYHHYRCEICGSWHTGHGYDPLEVTCADCGQTFIFSGGERKSHANKGWGVPKSCPSCRWMNSIIREERRIDCQIFQT